MSDPAPTVTADDILQILDGAATVVVAVNPTSAAAVAAVTGLAALIKRAIPAIRALHDQEISVAQQAATKAAADALRAEVGAAPAN